MEQLKEVLNEENSTLMAKELAEIIRSESNSETVEYDFHVNLEVREMNVSGDSNVWVKFDVPEDGAMRKVKDAMYEDDVDENGLAFIDSFMAATSRKIVEEHGDAVVEGLRRVMFQGKDVPLKVLGITHIDIVDFSSLPPEDNVQIAVEKRVPQSVLDENPAAGQVSVTNELFEIKKETGEDFQTIVDRKKAENDPNYEYVHEVHVSRMMWEGQVDLMVDFMPSENAETAEARLPQ
jgi:hypothetical protein